MSSPTPQPHGPWTILKSHSVYRDPFVHLRLDQVIRPDSNPGQHVVVEIKSGVCVLAVDNDHQVYLTSEFHYAVGRTTLEGVSGGIEPDESPFETAQRELAEELGLRARTWQRLATVDPFTSIMTSPTQLFLATDLSYCAAKPEGSELITAVKIPLPDAIRRMASGEITHAPTCIALMWLALELHQNH